MSILKPSAILLPLLATACPKTLELQQGFQVVPTVVEQANACAEELHNARVAYQNIIGDTDDHNPGYTVLGGAIVDPSGMEQINDVYDTSEYGFYQIQVVDENYTMALTRQGVYETILTDGTFGIDPNTEHEFNIDGSNRPSIINAKQWLSNRFVRPLAGRYYEFQSELFSSARMPDRETQDWLVRFNNACRASLEILKDVER
ncbi:MAG: hypothetical protein UV80_C0002G0129 [Candidatus Peregrinibacteria bacterium GW2011_GWF2_43_17]|nr:MAG: hypothetical protein UV80_C0002G0129 [Candidatus Peregrinibacteria bacterium GW2011_GWF2_43_17]